MKKAPVTGIAGQNGQYPAIFHRPEGLRFLDLYIGEVEADALPVCHYISY